MFHRSSNTWLCYGKTLGVLILAALLTSGCSSGDGNSNVVVNNPTPLTVGSASNADGVVATAVNSSGGTQIHSMLTFSVPPGAQTLVVEANTDGTSDPSLTGTTVTLSPQTGGRAIMPQISLGDGLVNLTGGTSWPVIGSLSASEYTTQLRGLSNVVKVPTGLGQSAKGRDSVTRNLYTYIVNPSPGIWQVEITSDGRKPFTIGVVVGTAQGLSSSTAASTVVQAYTQAGISISTTRHPDCTWWQHAGIEAICDGIGILAEGAFLAAVGEYVIPAVASNPAVAADVQAAYDTAWSGGCVLVAERVCEKL